MGGVDETKAEVLPGFGLLYLHGALPPAHRRAGAMGAFGFPQKAYGHQKLIIKHLSQGEAKSAGGSQWTNGLRQGTEQQKLLQTRT